MLRWRIDEGYLFAVICNRWTLLVNLSAPAEPYTGAGRWEW